MVPTAESGEGRRARERVRESGVPVRSGRSLFRLPPSWGRRRPGRLPAFPRSRYFVASGLRKVSGRGGGGRAELSGRDEGGELNAPGKRGGGMRSEWKWRPAGPAYLRGLRCSRRHLGWRGCGWLLTQTPGMRQGEPEGRRSQ